MTWWEESLHHAISHKFLQPGPQSLRSNFTFHLSNRSIRDPNTPCQTTSTPRKKHHPMPLRKPAHNRKVILVFLRQLCPYVDRSSPSFHCILSYRWQSLQKKLSVSHKAFHLVSHPLTPSFQAAQSRGLWNHWSTDCYIVLNLEELRSETLHFRWISYLQAR